MGTGGVPRCKHQDVPYNTQREETSYPIISKGVRVAWYFISSFILFFVRLHEGAKSKAGRWNNSSLARSYDTVVDTSTLLVFAGFADGERPFLARDQLLPPEELQRMIFPEVDRWLDLVNSLPGSESEVDDSLATHSFLLLLKWGRSVILQDSVKLREYAPSHPIWNHEVFNCSLYKKFEDDLKSVVTTVQDPNRSRLEHITPLLSNALHSVRQTVETNASNMERRFSQLEDEVRKISLIVSDGVRDIATRLPSGWSISPIFAPTSCPAEMSRRSEQASSERAGDESETSSESDRQVPHYEIDRHIGTLYDAWREWFVGRWFDLVANI